jgi:ribulose-phosphate 3-epimerase
MDGHFVPNLSMGPEVVRGLRRATRLPLDVHLMVSRPARLARDFLRAGADRLTIHAEADGDLPALLRAIRRAGRRTGVALKPGTSPAAARKLLPLADLVLAMTVEPGYGGQPFRRDVLPKIRALRAAAPRLDVQVDGGLSRETIGEAVAAGANVIVAGWAIFGDPRPRAAMKSLRRIGETAFRNGRAA